MPFQRRVYLVVTVQTGLECKMNDKNESFSRDGLTVSQLKFAVTVVIKLVHHYTLMHVSSESFEF